VLVYAVVNNSLSPDFPLGVELEGFISKASIVILAPWAKGA
jgi:hypothetical protein